MTAFVGVAAAHRRAVTEGEAAVKAFHADFVAPATKTALASLWEKGQVAVPESALYDVEFYSVFDKEWMGLVLDSFVEVECRLVSATAPDGSRAVAVRHTSTKIDGETTHDVLLAQPSDEDLFRDVISEAMQKNTSDDDDDDNKGDDGDASNGSRDD
jgi:hypothetical protein